MTPLDSAALQAAIREASRGRGTVTNYHLSALCDDVLLTATSQSSFIFLDREPHAWRVYYITRDASDLRTLLSTIDQRPLLVDVLVRDQPPYGLAIPQAFEASGFQKLARYVRMRTETLCARAPKRTVTPSGPELADAAWDLLCESFDPRLDHLMSRERLRELASLGQLFAAGTPQRVDAICVYELEGSLCNWRFWAARPGAHPAAAVQVLGSWLADMAARGITRGQLWVDGANTAPAATYERLGFRPDGVQAHIFALEAA